MTLRLRIDLAYEGTDFHGWARQPGLRTVQGELEAALSRVFRQDIGTVVAGRTDAGVHARHQVVHADVPAETFAALPGRRGSGRTPGEALAHKLRGALGFQGAQDLAVLSAAPAPEGFDARFSPLWREYRYRIADAAARPDPLRRRETTPVRERLDEAAMAQAARELLGLHDFLPFCKPREGSTTIRTLQRLDVSRQPDTAIEAVLRADAFCHHMVRSLIGALIRVGAGRDDVTWPAMLLARGTRDHPVVVAPAQGLVLERIGYPPDEELAARAEQTRARRQAP